jgi:hypothetical protein
MNGIGLSAENIEKDAEINGQFKQAIDGQDRERNQK